MRHALIAPNVTHKEVGMPEAARMDVVVLIMVGTVFLLGLWSMIFAFLYGFMKRLDQILLILREIAPQKPEA